MELTYLIENYSYLKFIVDVYEEYSKEHESLCIIFIFQTPLIFTIKIEDKSGGSYR